MTPRPTMAALPSPPRNGIPLLDHLAATLRLSRRAAKNLLDERAVFVNGKRIWMAKHPLQVHDAVEILSSLAPSALPSPSSPAKPAPARPETAPPPVRILRDSPHWLVADKTAGILANGPRSLETLLRDRLALPGLRAVHRLDRDTSGCLLFAKDAATRDALVAQFEENRIGKGYHVLVAGIPPESSFTIRQSLDRLPAVSHFRILSARTRAPRCAHLAVRIETGRTHQIRRHLQNCGYPVLGDRHYYSQAAAPFRGIPRQMLHASRLLFADPATGEPVRCDSPLPPDFRSTLRRLGLD